MNNDSKIPEGWAMPEDVAKKINEGFSKKTLRSEDQLADTLDELARDIALIEPDPRDWAGWVNYFLEQMEYQAEKRRLIYNYEQALESLAINIQNRIKGGN